MTLGKLIDEYGRLKAMADTYKKEAEDCNKIIKTRMASGNLEEEKGTAYKVNYYVQKRESINEDKALEILKKAGIVRCVKTVEVLDSDELEKMLYNGELPAGVISDLNTCRTVKEVPALKVSKLEEK